MISNVSQPQNLPQNPSSEANKPVSPPSVPPWMGKGSSESPQAAPPPAPPVEDLKVYKTSGGGGKKVITFLGIFFLVFCLSSLTFFSLKFLTEKKGEAVTQSISETGQELTPLAERNLRLGPGEKKAVVGWKQFSQEMQNSEVAEKVLSWLEEQRDSRGIYIYGYRCPLKGECGQQEADNRAGLSAIWGRFQYYQVSKEASDLAIINKDINLYSNQEVVGAIQNDFWNCKLMYEMWQSSLFSGEQKAKIAKICERGSYDLMELGQIDQQIAQGGWKEIDYKNLIGQRPAGTTQFQSLSDKGKKLIEYSAYASDFIAQYFWKKEEKDLTRAKLFFSKGVVLWNQTPQSSYIKGRCVLGTAALDLYEATGKADYLDFADSLFQKEKIKELCLASSEKLTSYFHDSLFEQATCGLFVNQLAGLAQGEDKGQAKTNLRNNLLPRLFSSPEYQDASEGRGAFFSKIEGPTETSLYRPVRENGLLVGFLMME
jgi:hypothetical protein